MCKCTPNIRTPFCGRPGCEWPKKTDTLATLPITIEDVTYRVGAKVYRKGSGDDRVGELLKIELQPGSQASDASAYGALVRNGDGEEFSCWLGDLALYVPLEGEQMVDRVARRVAEIESTMQVALYGNAAVLLREAIKEDDPDDLEQVMADILVFGIAQYIVYSKEGRQRFNRDTIKQLHEQLSPDVMVRPCEPLAGHTANAPVADGIRTVTVLLDAPDAVWNRFSEVITGLYGYKNLSTCLEDWIGSHMFDDLDEGARPTVCVEAPDDLLK